MPQLDPIEKLIETSRNGRFNLHVIEAAETEYKRIQLELARLVAENNAMNIRPDELLSSESDS